LCLEWREVVVGRVYQNFDLLIEQDGPGFRARVTQCPLAVSPALTFSMPFSEMELELMLLKLDPGQSGMRRSGGSQHAQLMMDFGGALFDALFRDDVGLAWAQSQEIVRRDGQGLRLRLRVADAPAAARLPWELLYDRRLNMFTAQSDRSPVVRFLDVPYIPRPLTVEGPLRILAVLSSPTDVDDLDVDREWRLFTDSLAPQVASRAIRLDRLAAATLPALADWLTHHEVHVLHFVGHGHFDERLEDGVLVFCDRYGRSAPVSASVLGPHLRDHDALRLVTLNACQSARADARDPYAGVAQRLVQQDVAAVVAMQFPISDKAAVEFSGAFYASLGDGNPVDQATTSGRKALIDGFPSEWATPVLFMRSPDGRIFDLARQTPVDDDVIAPAMPPVATSTTRQGGSGPITSAESRARGGGQGLRKRAVLVLLLVVAVTVGLAGTAWTLTHRQADPPGPAPIPSTTTTAVVTATVTLQPSPTQASTGTRSPGNPPTTASSAPVVAGSRTFTVVDSNLGGTWSRSDPDAGGTLPAEAGKPSNGATWYANNRAVKATCFRRAASYPVHYRDGHTESWTSWLHLTDGTWVPAAVMSEIHSDSLTGISTC